jgi:AAA15 family ATPase/GTPase
MKRISVKGYKAINSEKTVDLSAINLFIGKNGSGKSSFINSLLLAKGAFELELSQNSLDSFLSLPKDFFGNEYGDEKSFVRKKIFPDYSYSHNFNKRLINPFNPRGKFSLRDINSNSSQKEFSYSLPLELTYFEDSFDLELKYYLNENNNALLNGIKLINRTNNQELFSLQAKNLEDIARRKKVKKNAHSHHTYEAILKVDVDYLLNFLKNLKKDHIENREALIDEQDRIFSPEWMQEQDASREQYLREQGEFNQKLNVDFDKIGHCSLFDFTNNMEYKSESAYLLNWYNIIEDMNYFDYHSTSEEDELDAVDINQNSDLKAIAIELENKSLKSLKDGVITQWAGNSIADIMKWALGHGSVDVLFEKTFNYLSEEKKSPELEAFNVAREASIKSLIIFDQILFKNMFSSISNLNLDLNDIIYIPPNRIKKYKSNENEGNEEIIVYILNRLNEIKLKDNYEKPILHFINYWVAQFSFDKKFQINEISDLIEYFESTTEENKKGNDVGYGISQLMPIIGLLSLYSQKYEETNDEQLYNNGISQVTGLNNCFLIEEPESNLHPNFQSILADMFIDSSWKFGHQFLIETHSEYLVRKFQYWVAKGKIKPSDVNIYYFENNNEDPLIKDVVIRKISINIDGSLSEPFGQGFFDEADRIALELFLLKKHQTN